MADRRERAFKRIRGAQVFPVLGGEVVEGEQRLAVLDEARDRLVVLDPVGLDKGVEGDQRLRFGLGHPDVLERAFGDTVLTVTPKAAATAFGVCPSTTTRRASSARLRGVSRAFR